MQKSSDRIDLHRLTGQVTIGTLENGTYKRIITGTCLAIRVVLVTCQPIETESE